MTTALQTATISAPQTAYIGRQALAALGITLVQGKQLQGQGNFPNSASLAAALNAGSKHPDELLQAAAIDTALQFGVRITEFGLLGYTPRLLAVGFTAQSVAGGQVRAITAGDPVWLLWPWGQNVSHWDGDQLQSHLANGVADMLNHNWERAIKYLQWAAGQTANIANRELVLVRQAIAANISLAVQFSHGGAR